MEENLKRNIIINRCERVIREILYVFLAFFTFFCLTGYISPGFLDHKILNVYMYIPTFFLASLLITFFARKTIKQLFKESSFYKELHSEEHIVLIPILRNIWTAYCYFSAQCAMIMMFFPELGAIELNGVPVLLGVSIANCFLVYLFYSKYIFTDIASNENHV